jgi:DNA-binding winged helix-turn-helix (wHTH) protein
MYRFGVFEADGATGELRRQGVHIRLNAQPFQVLLMLLERPGELLTRDEICRELWPDGTFVDYEHGVNSAINRIREALGDTASSPRYIQTLARRGYRFLTPVVVAPVERPSPDREISNPIAESAIPVSSTLASAPESSGHTILASPQELPKTPYSVVQMLFILLQLMYLAFYVGALANLAEIQDLLSALPEAAHAFTLLIVTAAALLPVRIFVLFSALFHAPGVRVKFLRIWPALLLLDELWSLSPFLLLHHINFGLALASTALLVYSPFAQRSLVLMGAGCASSTNSSAE